MHHPKPHPRFKIAGGNTRLYTSWHDQGATAAPSGDLPTLRRAAVLRHDVHAASAAFPSLDLVGDTFVSYATRAQQFNIAVGRYVIMPDHLHLFVRGGPEFVLSDWIKGLKRSIKFLH
ncbi:MAG: transposase [Chthoniobacterales bacterium]|nr:transposase [Chthoniobacterales bacterium]